MQGDPDEDFQFVREMGFREAAKKRGRTLNLHNKKTPDRSGNLSGASKKVLSGITSLRSQILLLGFLLFSLV